MSGADATKPSDWQQRVLDGYDEQHSGRKGRRSVGIVLQSEELMVLREAARRRDISLAAFVRRCALAVAAHDLGVPYLALTVIEGPVTRFGIHEQGRDYAGKGFGPWIITEMREP